MHLISATGGGIAKTDVMARSHRENTDGPELGNRSLAQDPQEVRCV
jgi:hypothetical protein